MISIGSTLLTSSALAFPPHNPRPFPLSYFSPKVRPQSEKTELYLHVHTLTLKNSPSGLIEFSATGEDHPRIPAFVREDSVEGHQDEKSVSLILMVHPGPSGAQILKKTL